MNNFKKLAVVAGLGLALTTSSAFATDLSGKAYAQLNLGYNFNHTNLKDKLDTVVKTTEVLKLKKAKLAYGIAAGYRYNDNIRVDLSYTILSKSTYKSDNVDASASAQSILLNGYYDITSINDSFVPYVTLGLGMGSGKFNVNTNKSGYTSLTTIKSKNSLAYQAGLGVAFKINDQFSADLGYRFNQVKFRKNDLGFKKYTSNILMLGARVYL